MNAINNIHRLKTTRNPLSNDLLLRYQKLVELRDEIYPSLLKSPD
jgi:hypothetical protein